jgi:ABC-type sulfate transport system permease subunit
MNSSQVFLFVCIIAFLAFMMTSMWRVFVKAGQPGWAALIPIYNFVIILRIIRKPFWLVILAFIPYVNVVLSIIVAYELSKSFGKGIGFVFGLVFLPFIFYPILGFGSAAYIQEAPASSVPNPVQ